MKPLAALTVRIAAKQGVAARLTSKDGTGGMGKDGLGDADI